MTTSRAHQETVLAQRRAAVPDRSVWVSASAGTGKTKVLTDRVLSLLLAGTPPQRILCLTFTRAAAAEMSNRINDRLSDWAADEMELNNGLTDLLGHAPDKATCDLARRLFAMVLDVPGGMKIQTIHAFCESLLYRFPLEAGLAPHFDVMDERTAIEALHAARDVVLARARHGEDEALADALAEVAGRVNEQDFAELLHTLAGERGRLRRMLASHGGISGYRAALYGVLEVDEGETDGGIVAAACAPGAFDEAGLRRACQALSEGSRTDVERGAAIAAWLADAAARQTGLETYVRVFLTAEGGVRKTLITKAAAAAAPEIADTLAAEAARLQAVDERHRALVTAQATAALVTLGWAWLDAYDTHKLAHARLDYDDLILGARALLEEDGAAAWVLYKLDGGIDHILIDEAQDTNPDQWAVVRALAEEFFAGEGAREVSRTVFAVGDAKQSIYSFQRADPQSFAHMQVYFRQRVMAAGRKWDTVDLTMSFRSTPSVLEAVDTVFAEGPARVGVATAGEAIVHTPHREGQAGLVELWPAVEPAEAEIPAPWAPPVKRRPVDEPQTRLARVIAGRIGCWIDRNEMLESRNRPVRAGDIMVLVRRRTGFVDALIRALKQLNVPVAGVDRMVLSDQLAVKDLIVLGRFLLLPEDDLTLATVLKGPLFGLNEEDLFDLAHGRSGTLWRELGRRAGKQPYRSVHQELADLLGRADFVPPFELYADVLSRRGARHAITGRLGRDAGDPLDEFLSLALGFERNNAPSLQAFLHWIGAGEAEIKRDLEHGVRDEVRVMTVHGAKGLQAPIVFLPDTMQAPSRSPRLLWQGAGDVLLWRPRRAFDGAVSRALRDEARLRADEEYRRLLYVAMTRAEDRLYICGWHTRNSAPEHCWYNLAKAALGPSAEVVEMDFTGDAPDDGWQGAGLRLANEQDAPAEDAGQERRFVPPPEEPPAWARRPAPAEDVPPRPLVPSRPDEAEPATRSPVGADRGAAFRRGNLIHRLLQTLPGIDPAARAAAARRYLALPAHGLAQDQGRQLAAEVLAVLSAPEFADLFGPTSRAEVPLTGCVNGRVISGQVDRLVVEGGRVRIIDYKSNRPPPALIQDTPVLYLRQMAAYRAVLAEIYPAFSIDCAILWTDGPTLMGLPVALLAIYAP